MYDRDAKKVRRPGFMGRACVAWVVLNVAMFLSLGIFVYFLGPWMTQWYVILPVVVATIATEWVITSETIAPIIRDWIIQEEYIKDGDSPSWEKQDKRSYLTE
jgi:hypothetical protein